MDYGYNLSYSHLQDKNPLIKALYDANKKADKKIKKMLNRKYQSREQNSVEAILAYHEAVDQLPAYAEAIKKSYQNKVEEKRKEFIKPTDGNLIDSRLAMEHLRRLSAFERTKALKEQPELRNLAEKHKSVFGVPESDKEIFNDMENVFIETFKSDLQVEQESFDALHDLEVSFKLTLQSPFENLKEAEMLLENFIEMEDEDDLEKDSA